MTPLIWLGVPDGKGERKAATVNGLVGFEGAVGVGQLSARIGVKSPQRARIKAYIAVDEGG